MEVITDGLFHAEVAVDGQQEAEREIDIRVWTDDEGRREERHERDREVPLKLPVDRAVCFACLDPFQSVRTRWQLLYFFFGNLLVSCVLGFQEEMRPRGLTAASASFGEDEDEDEDDGAERREDEEKQAFVKVDAISGARWHGMTDRASIAPFIPIIFVRLLLRISCR